MKLLSTFIINYTYVMLLIYIMHIISKNNSNKKYLSIENSLCYSWIPSNKYEIGDKLCNINCTYIRHIPFPSNTPFRCKNEYISNYSENVNKNYKIYLFNTSTYGYFVKDYRFFHNLTYV